MAQNEPPEGKKELTPVQEFTKCPFNPRHNVRTHAFVEHILICEEIYTKERRKAGLYNHMAHCVHNYAHVYPRDKIMHHELHCPDQYRPPPPPVKNAKATTHREPEAKASPVLPVKKHTKTHRHRRTDNKGDVTEKSSPQPDRTIPGMQTKGGKKEQVELPRKFPDLNEMRKCFNEKYEKLVMEKRERLNSKANLDRTPTPPSNQELAPNRPISPDDLPKFGQLVWVHYWLKYLALPEQAIPPDEETEDPRESIPDTIASPNEMAPFRFQHELKDSKLAESGDSETETVIPGTSASSREPNKMDPSRIRRKASRRVRAQRLKKGGPSGDEADEEESD